MGTDGAKCDAYPGVTGRKKWDESLKSVLLRFSAWIGAVPARSKKRLRLRKICHRQGPGDSPSRSDFCGGCGLVGRRWSGLCRQWVSAEADGDVRERVLIRMNAKIRFSSFFLLAKF